jgi:hypothetical protein
MANHMCTCKCHVLVLENDQPNELCAAIAGKVGSQVVVASRSGELNVRHLKVCVLFFFFFFFFSNFGTSQSIYVSLNCFLISHFFNIKK